jgi:adenylate cyclase
LYLVAIQHREIPSSRIRQIWQRCTQELIFIARSRCEFRSTPSVSLLNKVFEDPDRIWEMPTVRRLAAILAADMAGYSRLMEADEEGTHQRLRAHFAELIHPKIAEHRGRVVKNTGDGLLAEFASVVEAVRCAIVVQREMGERNRALPPDDRIEFRIGINLGDVIAEADDIFGDGVNIAARIESLAKPGDICVSQVVCDQVRDRLDLVFADMGEQHVKNITRPVHVYRVLLDAETVAAVSTDGVPQTLALPDKPSLAVLPFINLSSDPEQEFFADGIAEDIITALSRYPSLFVIARNSCFTYKGRAVDVKDVGRELGVRYVLEGSLRKAGTRVRLTAQLIEAELGKHVWADRYDRDLVDIFAVQDEISEAVTIAVAPAIADAELHRAMRKPPQSLDAWTAYQRGVWHAGRASAQDTALAQKFFQQAVDLDPDFAGGYKGLSKLEAQAADYRGRGLADALSSAESLARRAVALDPADAEARSRLANALYRQGDYHGGLAEAELALAISPNLADAHGERGAVLIFSGRFREGFLALERAVRLDPRQPAVRLNQIALGLYFAGDYSAAVEAAKRAIRSYPDYPNPYRWLTAALGQLGRAEEAKEALEKAITIAPAAFDMYMRQRPPWIRPEDHAHMVEGLRRGGWDRGRE